MDPSSLLPEDPERVARYFAFFRDLLMRRKYRLAFTGLAGAGKSVLFQHLTGDVNPTSYAPPTDPSANEERGRLERPTSGVARVAVVPGQHSRPRIDSMDKQFGKKAASGIIHVVANGFVTTRGDEARRLLVSDGATSIKKYVEIYKRRETEDLQSVAERIKDSCVRHGKPQWLMIAVTKADLFEESLQAVVQEYSVDSPSAFGQQLRELRGSVGSSMLQIETRPVCSHLEDFVWEAETVPSHIDATRRNLLLARFLERILAWCPN